MIDNQAKTHTNKHTFKQPVQLAYEPAIFMPDEIHPGDNIEVSKDFFDSVHNKLSVNDVVLIRLIDEYSSTFYIIGVVDTKNNDRVIMHFTNMTFSDKDETYCPGWYGYISVRLTSTKKYYLNVSLNNDIYQDNEPSTIYELEVKVLFKNS